MEIGRLVKTSQRWLKAVIISCNRLKSELKDTNDANFYANDADNANGIG